MNLFQSNHLQCLRDAVFEVHKFPAFSLFLDHLEDNLDTWNSTENSICFVERTKLYGSSLFSGLFDKAESISIDMSPSSALTRGAYNSRKISSPSFVFKESDLFLNQDDFDLGNSLYNYVVIPNLIHHFKNQEELYAQVYRSLKPSGQIVVYEPTIRELHQEPHDYLRFTPYGLKEYLARAGFTNFTTRTEGNAYRALEYILQVMSMAREDSNHLRKVRDIMQLIDQLESDFPDAIVKNYSSFPTSFLLCGSKS